MCDAELKAVFVTCILLQYIDIYFVHSKSDPTKAHSYYILLRIQYLNLINNNIHCKYRLRTIARYNTIRYFSVIEHKAATLSAVTRSDMAPSTGGVGGASPGADVTSDEAPTCRGKN